MTTIRQILARKPDVYAVDPDATVLDALKLLEREERRRAARDEGREARRDLLRARLRAADGPPRPLLEGDGRARGDDDRRLHDRRPTRAPASAWRT